MNTDVDWHSRFSQQAKWTRDLRQYLFDSVGLHTGGSILEVGCGTGAILTDIPNSSKYKIHGLDIDADMIAKAARNAPTTMLTIGDAHGLPFSLNKFDITYCHYLLLWVESPRSVLQEMKRVTRPGGVVMVMAEPDYNERIDEPESLKDLGKLQTISLQEQGADVGLGSRLDNLFLQAGIEVFESGRLQKLKGSKPAIEPLAEGEDLEWRVMVSDLKTTLTQDQLDTFKTMHSEATEKGTRTIHIPTNFAWSFV